MTNNHLFCQNNSHYHRDKNVSLANFHFAPSCSDIIISHPDEMDKLEQYRSITDYKRTNNHQVDLEAGQIVHVIEKHDTGLSLGQYK